MREEYEILNKADIPELKKPKLNKWLKLLEDLPYNKVVKISIDSATDANVKRCNILGCFRRTRKIIKNINFTIHTRKQNNLDGTFELFVWKEPIN